MKTKTPKARVMYSANGMFDVVRPYFELSPAPKGSEFRKAQFPCLVQSFPTRAQAERAKKFANLSYEQKVEAMAKVIFMSVNVGRRDLPGLWKQEEKTAYTERLRRHARAVLAAMGVVP